MGMSPFRDICPCAVTFGYGPSGFINETIRSILGPTNFNFEEQIAPVHEEEYGDLHVDAVKKGVLTTVEVPWTRWTVEEFNAVFPVATRIRSGNELVFKSLVGQPMLQIAQNMMIRPIVNNVISTTRSEWIYIYHVSPVQTWTLPFDRETQRVTMVRFEIFPTQGGTEATRGETHQVGY